MRILVVEDDEHLRGALKRMLRGWDVTECSNGREALELLGVGWEFDIVLSDMEMPIMDGRQFFQALQHVRPELVGRFAFLTGGARDREGAMFLETCSVPVFRKPNDFGKLAAQLQELAGAA